MHVCLFDIDGTLINSGGAGVKSLKAAMNSAFQIAEPAEVAVHGRTDRGITRDLFLAHGIEDSKENWLRFRASYLEHLPVMLAELRGTVLPGVPALLNSLRDRDDVLLGLLTGNTRAGARIKLGHYGLADFFEFGGYGDHHFLRDDVAREAFDEVHARLKCATDPQNIWVIGDTPLDVRCARSIGARCVAVATGHHSLDELSAEKPDVAVAELSDPALMAKVWPLVV